MNNLQPTEEQLLAAANSLNPDRRYVYLLRDVSFWRDDFPPENAVEFQAWLAAKLGEVPEEHRGTLTLHWSGTEDGTLVSVFYTRAETDEEFAARVREHAVAIIRHETQELRQYQQLRAKFEPQQKD